MPVIETKGAISAQGFGEFAKVGAANYIEDVFSTWLYTGNGSTQTITNGIDLSGKGGMVWQKRRDSTSSHYLFDTARGNDYTLNTNSNSGQGSGWAPYFSFGSSGFTVDAAGGGFNLSSATYASWTFRKQPKFFDVVTYTGNDTARTISHSLGSVPGCIIVKNISTGGFDWVVYHRSLGSTKFLKLNTTDASATNATYFNADPTSTVFSIGAGGLVNNGGDTYIAYLFAHDAGGFGLTGTDNVISCGSYTSGTRPTVALGWEPQWILIKNSNPEPGDEYANWGIWDNMRGLTVGSNDPLLDANRSTQEGTTYTEAGDYISPTATGFIVDPANNGYQICNPGGAKTMIYIAIRRGPMRTPTTGTSVFSPNVSAGATGTEITTGFAVDLQIYGERSAPNSNVSDRLRGVSSNTTSSGTSLITSGIDAELIGPFTRYWSNTSFQLSSGFSSINVIYWNFRRAPGFFDVVCYTGTGSATTFNHNLGVVPELMIFKRRNAEDAWRVYANMTASNFSRGELNQADAFVSNRTYGTGDGLNSQPTASSFALGQFDVANSSGGTYVAYLFASCPGVSKVGSYTGTGTTQQINCGFTGGARFVLIKRTDSAGGWYVWDSARGIVAGNDPYLLLNSTAAEVTNTDYVDTFSSGFEISSTAPAAINANGGSFIFLAIA